MDKKNTATGAAIVNRSDRRRAHKPVKAEPPIGVPSVGSAPVETAPVETAPVETAPVETAPVETAPVETAPVETEAVKAEAVKVAPVETEAVKAEAVKAEAVKAEAVKAEAVKAEAVKAEAAAIERNILRRLFTGDKGARQIMLDVVTDLANSPDKDGNTFDVDRDDIGARIPKGLFRGILRIAKGQYDNTHPAYDLGKTIGGKAAVKAGGKDDAKAIAEAAAFLDISNSLPNLVAGIQRMTRTVHGTAKVMRENDVDKVPAHKAAAADRLAVVEKAQNGDDKAIAEYLSRKDATPVKAGKAGKLDASTAPHLAKSA